jgi:Na+/melibiose symporter-like transporter
LDAAALRDLAFVMFYLALFFMWTAYWVPFFLIPTFAQFSIGVLESWAFYLLVITNAATIPGRFLAVVAIPHLGIAGAMVFFSFSSAVLLYAWVGVTAIRGFEAWVMLLGIFMTPLAALYPATVPQLCPRPELLGTRMGMSSAAAALRIILGAPLSSALTDISKGQFWKMQIFIGSAMLLGSAVMTFVWWKTRKQPPK